MNFIDVTVTSYLIGCVLYFLFQRRPPNWFELAFSGIGLTVLILFGVLLGL
jgi:hypothetical protein